MDDEMTVIFVKLALTFFGLVFVSLIAAMFTVHESYNWTTRLLIACGIFASLGVMSGIGVIWSL